MPYATDGAYYWISDQGLVYFGCSPWPVVSPEPDVAEADD